MSPGKDANNESTRLKILELMTKSIRRSEIRGGELPIGQPHFEIIDMYLESRGISKDTLALAKELRALSVQTIPSCIVCPFINAEKETVAIHRTFLSSNGNPDPRSWSKDRKYLGSKSSGVSILIDEDDADTVIAAEGLETGLSFFQMLRQLQGGKYRLVMAGDAGNLEKISTTHGWIANGFKKIIVAADNDGNETGIRAAREILNAIPEKTQIFSPVTFGYDWNDVLLKSTFEREFV